MESSVTSQSTPAVTCAPWKPVSVKNDEPNRLVVMVEPFVHERRELERLEAEEGRAERCAVASSQSFDDRAS